MEVIILIAAYVIGCAIGLMIWAQGEPFELADVLWWPIYALKLIVKSFWRAVSSW